MEERPDEGRARWFAPKLAGVRALWLDRYEHALDFYLDTYNFVALEECSSEVMFRRTRFHAPSGRVCVLAPDGVLRHVRMPGPETLKVLYLEQEFVGQAWEELGNGRRPPPALTLPRCTRLFRGLMRVHACMREPGVGLELPTQIMAVLELWSEGVGGSDRPSACFASPKALNAARELLHARFRDSLTIEELAREAGLSRFHFVRAFSRAFGVPPHTYQIHLRAAHASQLLNAGASACAAAQAAGFVDQTHLNRHFVRRYGVSAAAYARSTGPGPMRTTKARR